MNTLKNTRRALLLLLLATAPLISMTNDMNVSAQTPAPAQHWSLVSVYVRNTVGAIKHDLEELAEEFPQLSGLRAGAETDDDSLSYAKGRARESRTTERGAASYAGESHAGDGCRVVVEFRYPLTRAEADRLDASWRVYRLKDGKLLAAWSHVGAADNARGRLFRQTVSGVVRSAEAQLLDHAGADTRGSTRDLEAARYDGNLERGKLYRAEIAYDRERWEWVPVIAPNIPVHHAGRFEWLNAGHFPGLYFDRPPGARVEVVFQVVAVKVERMTERRWNTTYECRIVGVEGRDPPPRADYLTLVGKCRSVRGTMKRDLGYYFTFDVRRVVAGRFDAREFTIELSGNGASALLGALGSGDVWPRESDCSSAKEVELTFEVPAAGGTPERPGLLHVFRVIE